MQNNMEKGRIKWGILLHKNPDRYEVNKRERYDV